MAPANRIHEILSSHRDQILNRSLRELKSKNSEPDQRYLSLLPVLIDTLATAFSEDELNPTQLENQKVFAQLELNEISIREFSFYIEVIQSVLLDFLEEASAPLEIKAIKKISAFFQNLMTEECAHIIRETNRKHTESQIQFKQIVQEAKDYAIFMLDPDGLIQTWNEGAERVKKYKAEEVIGQHFRLLYRPEDRDAGRPEQNLKNAIKEGRTIDQWWRRKKDGSIFWAEVIISPFYSPDGKLLGFSKIVRDLSEKKAIEDELRKTKDLAEAASSVKSLFVANMSHEIRTPLGAILGFSDLLKDPSSSDQDKVLAAEIITRNGKMLLRLIEDILDLSKIEAGKLEVQFSETPLRALLGEVAALHEIKAREKNLSLSLNIDADVPDYLHTDPVRLRQIISNIVGNAIKFTEHGLIRLEVHKVRRADMKKEIEIVVTDTGPGLTPMEQESLFKPFSQADNSATRKFGGTGLGLSLSRDLAKKLGGGLHLLNCPHGQGCSFSITICDMQSEANVDSDRRLKRMLKGSRAEAVPLHAIAGEKILVVEDSQDNQLLIQMFLKKWGIFPDFANNGLEGVEKAIHGNYDVVFMDIQMPVMNGTEAVKKLRHDGYTGPIVALSAHAMNEEKTKAYEAGCDAYLVKPLDQALLHEVLKRYAHHSELQ